MNMQKNPELSSGEKITEKLQEKEKSPRKVIVLVRHPAQEFKFKQPYALAREGEDVGTHLPLSIEGLKQIRQLSEYLEKGFPWQVEDREYAIYSSPIKRAQRGADILRTNINLTKADGKKIPVPVNSDRTVLDCFSEVVFATDKVVDEKITKEAKKRGADIMAVWLEMEGEKLLPRFQSKLEDLRRGFDFLGRQSTKVDIVVSHGLAIATAVWATRNVEKFKDSAYKITVDDVKEILDVDKNISHTSITEFKIYDDKIEVGKVGATPHLDKKE